MMAKIVKLCASCYAERFPGKKPTVITWSATCGGCQKPTPNLGYLFKVRIDQPCEK